MTKRDDHAEDAQESRSAQQDLRDVRVAVFLAQEMGAGLGLGSVLFGPVPKGSTRRTTARKSLILLEVMAQPALGSWLQEVQMTAVADILGDFAARPWMTVTEADLGAADRVPTMLTWEESQLYHWLGRRAQGIGATVDLGAYAGGSAARLLSGLALSDHAFHVHAYDRFRSSRAFWARYMPDEPLPATNDADLLPVARRNLSPWQEHVTLHVGDIGEMRWTEGPIEILSIDAAKGAAMTDHIAAAFFPALVAGRSIVVHQDYLMSVQPWLCAQMVALRDQFLPLAHVPRVGMLFLCTDVPSAADLARARVDSLTDGALMRRVRDAAEWHAGMARRAMFKAMLIEIKANPGVRLGWQMRHAAQARAAKAQD